MPEVLTQTRPVCHNRFMNLRKSKSVEGALAAKLATLRAANGWTYEQMAERMNEHGVTIHPSAIQKTEKSGRGVTLTELIAYSKIYGISVGDLLDEDKAALNQQAARDAETIQRLANELAEAVRRAVR